MQGLKPVLLIEDDIDDVMTIERALREIGVLNEVVHVENGQLGLNYLRNEDNEEPYLIFLDLNTPQMKGHEFLALTKADERLKDIPVIVLSASSDRSDIRESFKLGAAGYVTKCFSYEKFVEALVIVNQYWTLSKLPSD